MTTIDKTNEIINILILIHEDRIAGLEKAGEDIDEKNSGWKLVFAKLADESRSYLNQLSGLAREYGLEPREDASASGSLPRARLYIESTFTGNDPISILEEYHRGENAIASAYRSVLSRPNEMSPELYQLLIFQQKDIQGNHDRTQSLLDHPVGMDAENTVGCRPGYEKQNIPGMEPPEHYAPFKQTGAAPQ